MVADPDSELERSIRARYSVPRDLRMRCDGREVLVFEPSCEVAARAVASRPESLPRAQASGRVPLRRIQSPDGPLLVRTYSKGGLLRRFRGTYFAGAWRPLRELVLHRQLMGAGVPVVEAVACVIHRRGAKWRGHLLTRECSGAIDLDAWLRRSIRVASSKDRVVPIRAGEVVRMVHDAGVRHGDLHPKNLILTSDGSLRVLDFDKSRAFERPLTGAERLQDLARLARSIEKHRLRGLAVGPRLGLRFLEGYAGDRKAAREWWVRIWRALGRTMPLREFWWMLTGQLKPDASVNQVQAAGSEPIDGAP